MIRIALALFVAYLAVSIGGAQGGVQATAQLGLRATGFGAAVMMNPTGALTGCQGSRCYYTFDAGTRVTLTATPSGAGTSFATWLGACQGAALACTVAMDGDRSVTARFSPVGLYIGSTPGQGSVERSTGPSCGAGCTSYPYGTTVHLAAHACCDYRFDHWSGYCASVNADTCVFRIYDTTDTTPVFRCAGSCVGVTQQPLSRDVKARVVVSGAGKVQINGKDCFRVCDYVFTRAQSLVLRAFEQGSRFLGWSGNVCRGTDPRCQFSAFPDPVTRQWPFVRATFG